MKGYMKAKPGNDSEFSQVVVPVNKVVNKTVIA